MSNNTYNIYSTNGEKQFIVDENTTNTETSITLIGHGMPDYGEEQNTNFIHLLENFASNEEPKNPIIGQLWYKTDVEGNELYICVATNFVSDSADSSINDSIESGLITPKPHKKWVKIPLITFNDKAKHKSGDLKYDEREHTLYVYDGTKTVNGWNKIGPDNKVEHKTIFLPTTDKMDGKRRIILVKKDNFYDSLAISGNTSSTGNLNMIKMTVLAKEFSTSNEEQRSCGWIFTFMVRGIKSLRSSTNAYKVSIVGKPNYELIGKTENTNWTVEIDEDDNNIYIDLLNYDKLESSSDVDFSCYFDIIRI